jgi:hypothetical protein
MVFSIPRGLPTNPPLFCCSPAPRTAAAASARTAASAAAGGAATAAAHAGGPNPQEVARIKAAILRATSLEEVRQLEAQLKAGNYSAQ